MHDLDSRATYDTIDSAGMRYRLETLADQCEQAYNTAQQLTLPATFCEVRYVVITGMGGSAIGAELAQALASTTCSVPVSTWRNYGLPAYASGAQTLVIVSSKSGDTEETLSTFDTAVERGCSVFCLTTGGALAARAASHGIPLLQFDFSHQPREAIGWLCIPLLSVLQTLGILPDISQDMQEMLSLLRDLTPRIGIDSPAIRNPVKRMAGQVVDRLPIIYGSGIITPVARRWKTTLNETAKLMAVSDEIPELNHNTVVGFVQAEAIWRKSIVLQLRSTFDHPRVAQRFDLTTQLMLEAGINQDTVRARGKSPLAQVFSLIQFGDWMSYYAAIMMGCDPTPTDAIGWIKAQLAD